MKHQRLIFIITLIIAAAASRLFPHPPNVAPIAAMALFGGAYFADRRLAFFVPLAALFVSDLMLGLHNQMPAVYLGFCLVVCVGFSLRGRTRVLPIAVAALASSILFFLVSNFGVWASGNWYPKTAAGLGACYVAGIPFFRNTLLGDALYAALLFGIAALAERRFSVLRAPASAVA